MMLRFALLVPFTLALVLAAPFAALAQTGPTTEDLALWLKADSGLSADGSTWADSSGNGHNATALAGEAPTVKSNALNGLPVAVFSGRQSMSIAGYVLSKSKFMIMAVVTDKSVAGGGYREVISNWQDVETGPRSVFLGTIWSEVDGVVADRIRFTDSIGGQDQGQTGQGQIAKPTHAFILTGRAGHDALIRLDGKTQYNLGGPLSKRRLKSGWYLGVQAALASEFWEGDIAEVLVYNAPLSKEEFLTNLTYLETKWLPAKK